MPVLARPLALRLVALGLLLVGQAAPGAAQGTYPNRPIKWIVSFPPGGSTDVVARAMLPSLEKRLGQPVVIENRGGAGGNLGVDAVAKAEPDGYSIGFAAAGALAVNVSLVEKMPFNVAKDLIPITLVGTSPFILVATPKFEASTISDVSFRSGMAATVPPCISPPPCSTRWAGSRPRSCPIVAVGR